MAEEGINLNVPHEVAGAVWENIFLDNGYDSNFYISFPEHYDENTPIIIYEHGGGRLDLTGNDLRNYNLGLYNDDIPAIVICYNRADYRNQFDSSTGTTRLNIQDVLTHVNNKYGVSSDNLHIVGFSSGFTESFCDAADYRISNPNAPVQSIFLLDGYPNGRYASQSEQRALSAMKVLGESGDMVFALHSPNVTANQRIYETGIREYGVNLLWIEDKRTNEYGASIVTHCGVNESYVTNDLVLFDLGLAPFPEQGYLARRYIQTTDGNWEWVQVDIGGMMKHDVYDLFGISFTGYYESKINNLKSLQDVSLSVSSDSDVLGTCINGVIGKIRTSNFVQNSVSFDGGFGGSTTSVPTQIPGVVSSFFDSNATFLTLLANDMSAISQIGASIEEINSSLAILAGELDPSGTPPVEPEEQPTEPEEEPTEPEEEPTEPEEEPDANGGIITEEGGILEKGEDGEYITEEGGNENPTTMGDTVGGEDGETPGDNPENQGAGDGNASEPEPENNGDKPENQGEQPTNNPNTNGEGTTPIPNQSPNQSPNQTPGYSPPSNPTPSPTPGPSQSPQNNSGMGNLSVGDITVNNNPLGEFPEYSEVYSNDNMIVYNYNDEYKIVIHTDGDKIIGIEHYYDFGNASNADHALDGLMNQYGSNENLENIVQSDRYVKVIFETDMYENMTIDEIRDKYSNLSEIIHL